jgi:flagellar biosynthesis/type III secretory pathway M-ring protein FliF/YscJ
MKMMPSPKSDRNDSLELLRAQKERSEQLLEGGGHSLLPQQGLDFKGQGELLAIVKQDPYQTAQILQNWLKQRD